jgi:glycosyltransferase involved in cell wall biosynthesis
MAKLRVKPIFGTWLAHKEIIDFPPEGVDYGRVSNNVSSGKYYQKKKYGSWISGFFQFFNLPRMIPLGAISEDLIHTSRGIIPMQFGSKKPWVMDIEHASSFVGLNGERLNFKFTRKIIRKHTFSKECKKVMPHVKASVDKLLENNLVPREKIEVLYPATHVPKIEDVKRKDKNIRFVFVSSLFEDKGGVNVLECFKRLSLKYLNLELWIKSDVPEEIKKEYDLNNIKYLPFVSKIIPREELLKKIYAQCDVCLYPSLVDSFGGALLDAMCCKLPIITNDNYAFPEIVEDGENGFIVNMGGSPKNRRISKVPNLEKSLNELVRRCSELIENKGLRKRMGEKGYKLVTEGKFSIKYRNKQLKTIYSEALK